MFLSLVLLPGKGWSIQWSGVLCVRSVHVWDHFLHRASAWERAIYCVQPVSAGQRQSRQKKWSVNKWQPRHAELDAIWFGGWTIIKKVRTANGEHRHSKCRHHIVNAMRFVPAQPVFRFEGIVLAISIITRFRRQDSSVGRAGDKIRLDFSENRW